MKDILFLTMHSSWPWFRQTQDGAGVFGEYRFHLNSISDQRTPQWIVAVDELQQPYITNIPKERRLLFITEPPAVKVYTPSFMNQFGVVFSPFRPTGFDGLHISSNPCLNWHYGVNRHDTKLEYFHNLGDLTHMPRPAKIRCLSVICSSKQITPEQLKRIELVKALKEHFGKNLDIFGRGTLEIQDKAEAISPYKYHIVLENNNIDNFWTEKLSDCLLGWSFPIYCGAGNITSTMPGQCIRCVKYSDITGAIAIIQSLLEEDPYNDSAVCLEKARNWIITETNIFKKVTDYAKESDAINSPSHFNIKARILPSSRFKRVILRNMYKHGLYQPIAR